jgi:2-polyprenyl-6-methoxyphenol hydroxylase-like FAD-dependent oxidoreductase
MPAAHTVLVIGGGIAGPVAATALAMAGIDAAIYEARPADPVSANGIGGSLALEPNGLGKCPHRRGFRRASSSTAAHCTLSCAIARNGPVYGSTTTRS